MGNIILVSGKTRKLGEVWGPLFQIGTPAFIALLCLIEQQSGIPPKLLNASLPILLQVQHSRITIATPCNNKQLPGTLEDVHLIHVQREISQYSLAISPQLRDRKREVVCVAPSADLRDRAPQHSVQL